MFLAALCRKGAVMTIIMRIYQVDPIDGVVSVKSQNRGPTIYMHEREIERVVRAQRRVSSSAPSPIHGCFGPQWHTELNLQHGL